jgi:indolepyruvate decarboxylase
VDAIVGAVSASKTACVLPGILVSRCGLSKEATTVIDASGLPFSTMFMDKCVLDEAHPNYIGMYDGRLMNDQVRAFVEGCDCVIGIGAMLTDFNSGAFTAKIDRLKSMNIMHNSVRVGTATYNNVAMKDVLLALAKKLPRKTVQAPKVHGLGKPMGKNTSTRAGSRCSSQMTYSSPKPGPPRWGSLSL